MSRRLLPLRRVLRPRAVRRGVALPASVCACASALATCRNFAPAAAAVRLHCRGLSTTCSPAPLPQKEAWELWGRVDAVCFDVDSTVIREEGIDVMADFFGVGDEVATMTRRAMEGDVKFHDALQMRLDVMSPPLEGVSAFMAGNNVRLTPGIKELVQALHDKGVQVFLVSGGFREVIEPIADILKVPRDHIFANRIVFHADGTYKGFDDTEPTSQAGGKAVVVGMLKKRHNFRTVAMVGDGATDLEARPPADLFVGFGGIMERQVVREGADIFVKEFEPLIRAL